MENIRVLVCRLAPLENMGVVATLMGLIKSVRSHMPDAEITVFSYLPAKYQNLEKLGIKLRQYPWWRAWGRMWPISPAVLIPFDFFRCFFYRLSGKFNKTIKTPYEQYDVIIDNNTEHLKEELYGSRSVAISLLQTLLAWAIFRRPLATTPTSVGPFSTRLNKWLARQTLNKVDLLALREEANYQYCHQLGLNKPKIYFVSDPSFLLEPVPPERVDLILQQEGIAKGDKPFIGFSPNWFEMERFTFGESVSSSERGGKYVQLMAEVIDYVVDRLDATVCFIPHVTGGLFSGEQNNDRAVCYQIYDEVRNKQAVEVLRGEYLPDELKGVIGICDMFIGCRMHATIASTSLGIPTIAIAYGDKYYRIIGDTMGQEEYIVDVRNPSYDEILTELKSKVDSLWENRDKVREVLRERAKLAEQAALSYGKLIQELAEKPKRRQS